MSVLLLCLSSFSACATIFASRESIIKLYEENEAAFADAAANESFTDLAKLPGVYKVKVYDEYVDIMCGGGGFGASTQYRGIFFSATDDLCAVPVSGPRDELVIDGTGYRYEQVDGDNEYFVEPLGNHYFYYEASF